MQRGIHAGDSEIKALTVPVQKVPVLTGGLISERRTWELIKDREIAHVRIGRRVAIPVAEVERLIQKHTVPAVDAEKKAAEILARVSAR